METIKNVALPITDLSGLRVGDRVSFRGKILCGRDAVLPKICSLINSNRVQEINASFFGGAILHTAVSCAGIGPTSSNKVEIEESFEPLCKAGIKVFLGKGELHSSTIDVLAKNGAVFAVVPPVTAILNKEMKSCRCVAYSELGMEALYEVELDSCPAIIAIANGESIFGGGSCR